MPFQPNYQGRAFVADTTTFDLGLRRHMIAVYNVMMLGLIVSGLVAYEIGHDRRLFDAIYLTNLHWLAFLSPFAFLLVLQIGINNLSSFAAQVIFVLFSASMGLSLSAIFMEYTHQSITQVFFATSAMFLGTSLYGYTTKADLTRMGSFLLMALIGIIIGSVINIFMHSGVFGLIITLASVVVFTGFTAYDTQAIRNSYSQGYGVESNAKLAVLGALRLYLDFINLFVLLLQLFGNRRSN